MASSMFGPMDLNSTSSASCVKPRWLREPNIVCVYTVSMAQLNMLSHAPCRSP